MKQLTTTNYHKLIKFYKTSQDIVLFLRSYVEVNGVCVSSTLVMALEEKYGCRYTPQWITVILKSANIKRANRSHRKKKTDLPVPIAKNDIQPSAGLSLFKAFFEQGICQSISDNIVRRDAYNVILKLGIIIASGFVKRISNYESYMIEEISENGKSLSEAIHNISINDDNLCDRINASLLSYWLEQNIQISLLYADGHSKIWYTSKKALCGKISGIDRCMPGTKMSIICQQDGMILWLEMHQINEHLGYKFIEDAFKVMCLLPDVSERVPLIIDRESSGDIYSALASDLGIPVLTLLKTNSYNSISDFVELEDCPGLYKFSSLKKENDSRLFYPYKKNNGELIIYSVNFESSTGIDKIKEWYNGRWNGNENPLKVLLENTYFDINVCQEYKLITNPKQLEIKQKAEIEISELKLKLENENRKNPRKECTKHKKCETLKKLEKKIQRCEDVLKKPIDDVAVRKTTGDWLISLIKCSFFNLVLCYMLGLKIGKISTQKVGFFIQAIIRRPGSVDVNDHRVLIKLKPYRDRRTRLKQIDLIKAINKSQIRTKKGQLIVFDLIDQHVIKRKNLSNS